MKRYLRFFTLALIASTLVFPQSVKIKRLYKTPGDLKVTPWVGTGFNRLKGFRQRKHSILLGRYYWFWC